jgi:hypothetical protein
MLAALLPSCACHMTPWLGLLCRQQAAEALVLVGEDKEHVQKSADLDMQQWLRGAAHLSQCNVTAAAECDVTEERSRVLCDCLPAWRPCAPALCPVSACQAAQLCAAAQFASKARFYSVPALQAHT